MQRIELKDAIASLRAELIESILVSQREAIRFAVGEITLEFHIEVEKNLDSKGGFKFWVIELGGGGGKKDKATHKVTIPLKPVMQDGRPILTGDKTIPE